MPLSWPKMASVSPLPEEHQLKPHKEVVVKEEAEVAEEEEEEKAEAEVVVKVEVAVEEEAVPMVNKEDQEPLPQDSTLKVTQSSKRSTSHSLESQEKKPTHSTKSPEPEEEEDHSTRKKVTENSTPVIRNMLPTRRRVKMEKKLPLRKSRKPRLRPQSQSQRWKSSVTPWMNSWPVRRWLERKNPELLKVLKEPRFKSTTP